MTESAPKRIVVFAAHGDDLEFTCGGTIAKLTDRGHQVALVVATDNDKDSFELTAGHLRAARDKEIHRAAELLGIDKVICLGFSDGELREQCPVPELRGTFMRIIRELRADITFAWDPFAPYEGHPDHRTVATAANEASSFSHFPLYHPEQIEERLQPHYVAEQWYFAKAPRGQNKFVDISGYIDKKIEALCLHESQTASAKYLANGGLGSQNSYLERETRVELATPAALGAVLCSGSIGLGSAVYRLGSRSAGNPQGCCMLLELSGTAESRGVA